MSNSCSENDPSSSFDDNNSHCPHNLEFEFAKPASPSHLRKRAQSLTALPDHLSPFHQGDKCHTRAMLNGTPVKFHTPVAGRVVKPMPAAFHSTGLLLKRNGVRREGKAMPETPLKRGQTIHAMGNLDGMKSVDSFTSHNASSGMGSAYSTYSTQSDPIPGTIGFASSPTARIGHTHRPPLHERVARRNVTTFSSPLSNASPKTPIFVLPPYPNSPASHKSFSSTRLGNNQKDYRPHDLARVTDPFNSTRSSDGGHNDDEEEDVDFLPALRAGSDEFEDDVGDMVPRSFPIRSANLGQPDSSNLRMNAPTSLLYSPHVHFLRADYFIGDWYHHTFQTTISHTTHSSYFEDNFSVISLLGSGQFAEAYKVQSHVDGQYYAIKKSKHPYNGFKDRQQKLYEVMIMWKVSSSSRCIRLMNAWEQSGHLFLQMELCEGGTLLSYFEQNSKTGPLADSYIWQIITQVALGLKELHDQDIVHLDIKPDNIFINAEKFLKIGDFGMATVVPVPQSMEREGDRRYMAPEVLDHTYSKPADIYSLGLIALEAATNVILPENGVWWQRLRQGGGVMRSFEYVKPPLSDVIDSMLAANPQDRPTANDLLGHPCISAL
ncbi:hypothetical protein SeLEV6574_g03270 [Synchytrium endobioticum]|uniref:Protein kinase domain-containing protein n=1 Tax=Synchytrium endobioticum TaxID=286115 RepID=A0A507D4Y0_9FUNG|nr:hypothetical protein SeLEV6574_g03270 [Synchytrium endobioticum]